MIKGLCVALSASALPEYPFAEQTAFQASEPTVIRINMDVPRYSDADLANLQQKTAKSFLAKSEKAMPNFNVKYFFPSQKNTASAAHFNKKTSAADILADSEASLRKAESML